MKSILEYIIKLFQEFKKMVSRKSKTNADMDNSGKTILLYNPNIPSNVDDDRFDIFMVENPNKKLRIKIFNK